MTLVKPDLTENTIRNHDDLAGHPEPRKPSECRIVVIGVGGVGNNTVTRLMESNATSAECIAINSDVAHLRASKAHHKVLIGEKLVKGQGVGGDPSLGRMAIDESRKRVEKLLPSVDIVFVTAGLGGGTGTGAAPVVAEIARRKGALTVGVVTMPFRAERDQDKNAALALTEMRRQCHTVVVIDDDRLLQFVPQLPIGAAFRVADQVLANMIKGIVETMSTPSLINLDPADFKTIVRHGGMAVVGMGEADTPNRAEDAVRNALRTQLLDVDYARATGALINVTGDNHMTIQEVNRVGEIVTQMMDGNARVIWGACVNPQQEGKLKVTLVMTGVTSPHSWSGLGRIASQLFNLESNDGPEISLNVKLDLYQMEPETY